MKSAAYDLGQPAAIAMPAQAMGSRVGSIDAFRGFVMLLMMSEVLGVDAAAKALPGNHFWAFLNGVQSHLD